MKNEEMRKVVREGYGRVAKQEGSCCGPSSCRDSETISRQIGYTDEDLKAVPEGANLGLGCGNPIALASLREGEIVLDLGSGAGFDCFLAAKKVGKAGKVIGVDMTPEMIEKARENAEKGNHQNVEFRLGEIENLPAADNSVEVVISNCVINLSPEKHRVFQEAFRVLKPGGRMLVSDIVLLGELPEYIRNSVEAYVGCISGAVTRDRYLDAISAAGFQEIEVIGETTFPLELMANDPTAQAILSDSKVSLEEAKKLMESVASIKVFAVKPS